MATGLVAMAGHHVDMVEAVIGRGNPVSPLSIVAAGLFGRVIARLRLPGFFDRSRLEWVTREGLVIGEGLQVRLANGGRAIAAGA